MLTFNVTFQCPESTESFRRTYYWHFRQLHFWNIYFLNICPIFVDSSIVYMSILSTSNWKSLVIKISCRELKVPKSAIFHLALKVRQIRNDFFKPTFLPKNEWTNLTLLLVDLFSFVFWKKVKTPKRHFEINWPLDISN